MELIQLGKYIKVYGAGSIGNHLTNAAVELGYKVTVVDIDETALERMKNDIYPNRYGKWNDDIDLFLLGKEPRLKYDLVCIGTPPSSHIDILLSLISDHSGPILVEKPLCQPTKSVLSKLQGLSKSDMNRIFVGYNHVVSKASKLVEKLIKTDLGTVLSIDVEFREHWGGIFAAHHWLSGPEDSYLCNISEGGGSSGEHSHALNLWQHFSRISGKGEISKVFSQFNIVDKDNMKYDDKVYFVVETEKGFKGSITQDVITYPSRKTIKIQGSNLFLEWICNFNQNNDLVKTTSIKNIKKEYLIKKSRPDDFIIELRHILDKSVSPNLSPINLRHGIKTMEVLIASIKSNTLDNSIKI